MLIEVIKKLETVDDSIIILVEIKPLTYFQEKGDALNKGPNDTHFMPKNIIKIIFDTISKIHVKDGYKCKFN